MKFINIISFGITVGCSARLKIPSFIGIEPKSITESADFFKFHKTLSNASLYVILELWPTESGNLPEW